MLAGSVMVGVTAVGRLLHSVIIVVLTHQNNCCCLMSVRPALLAVKNLVNHVMHVDETQCCRGVIMVTGQVS